MDSDLNEVIQDNFLRKTYQNLGFVVVGSLGVLVWDILSNLKYEYCLLQRSRWSLSTVVYFLARTTTVAGFVLGAKLSSPSSDDNCILLLSASSWMTGASISLTTLLFFFRIRAVYNNDKYITGLFFLLWLGVVGLCIFQPLKGEIPNDSPQNLCKGFASNMVTLVTSMSTVPMVYDVLGFCAVAWRLFRNTHVPLSFKDGFRVIMLGKLLPHFSRAFMRDSQVYFLSTVIIALLSTTLFYSSPPLSGYGALLVFPNIALMNLMGCRIYRHTKLQLGKYTTPDSSFSSIGFRNSTAPRTTDTEMVTNQPSRLSCDVQPSTTEGKKDERLVLPR